MRRSADRSHLPAIFSSKTVALPPDSDLPPTQKPHHRRRIRNPTFPSSFTATRLRRIVASSSRSGPTTPFLRWKFNEPDRSDKPSSESVGKNRWRSKNSSGEKAAVVSARKLAAGFWQLQIPEPVHGHPQLPNDCNPNSIDLHTNRKNEFASPFSVHNPNSGSLHKLESSVALSNSVTEKATKWDPGCPKGSDDVYRFYGHLKLLEDQQVITVSVVSALQAELEQARTRVNELESERRSSRKKLDHFLRKLEEEKALWQTREHEKIHSVIDDVKNDLNRSRKNRQRMEIVNSKLVNELAEAKLSAKRYLQDYEKEWKARELLEEVCDELAKEIGEDKAEVEALKRESMNIREDVDEERKMLQMAEVWREERVQMKLIDAKLMLEEKYSQLSKLQGNLEAFLRARSSGNSDVAEMKEAELLREAADAVKVEEIKEFSYQPPPASEDIFSVFEKLQSREETKEREIEPCYGYSPANPDSKIHTVSPEINGFTKKPIKRYTNGAINRNIDIEDDSGWETVTHVEEQGSCNSPEGSDPSVDGIYEESRASVSGTDWEEIADNSKLNGEFIEVCSVTTRQSRNKASSIGRIWRSSCPNNGEHYKTISVEEINGRLSNGRISNGTISPDRGSAERGLSPQSVGQWSSPDSVNPYITRGMKGCIEWPRGMQKHRLKAKLLEARMESQKLQLRHVLEQKI